MKNHPTFGDASISCLEENHWCVYADGFFLAAEIIVENIRSTYEVNTVVFPIMFLYRQYIELSLKETIALGHHIDGSRHGTPQSHDLKNLWNEAKACIHKHIKNIDKDEVNETEQVILNMHELDPTSEESRYPVAKKRKCADKNPSFVKKIQFADKAASFSRGPTHINLQELATRMKIVYTFFYKTTSVLSVTQEHEADWRNEIPVSEL